jgi:nicotinamidase-related amidase
MTHKVQLNADLLASIKGGAFRRPPTESTHTMIDKLETPICEHSERVGRASATPNIPRRLLLGVAGATATGLAIAGSHVLQAAALSNATDTYADPVRPFLPQVSMTLDLRRTALVIIDPQIDFLSPRGMAWEAFGSSITEHNTVANLTRLFRAAKQAGIPVAVSPHFYYPYDKAWKFGAAGETAMHHGWFARKSPLSVDGFENSGADWMPEFKPFIEDGKTIICSPHKLFGSQQNDLALQLHKRRIDQILLAGMSANLCVESHLRDLVERGFEVAVVRDATAGAKLPEGDGYLAALVNYRWLANAIWTTEEASARLAGKA